MIAVRRLKAVGIVLGLAAVLTCTHVWGEPGRDKSKDVVQPADSKLTSGKADQDFAQDMAVSRFTGHPLVTYQAEQGGPLLAALQLQPKVDAPARPLDVVVLVEDAAGMAQGPMIAAQKTAESLAASLGAEDRMALWTVSNKANDLSRGFKSGDKLKDAFKDLAKDYPSGAVDLKMGLDKRPRQRSRKTRPASGRSCSSATARASPIPWTTSERGALCDSMASKEIAFFAVPMGTHGDPANLHGLVSGTGGKIVRFFAGDKPEDMAKRLKEAFAQPILYPTAFQAPAGAADVLPTRLPPLRGDTATLVLCKLAPGVAKFDYTVTGKAGGQDRRFTASEAVPAPKWTTSSSSTSPASGANRRIGRRCWPPTAPWRSRPSSMNWPARTCSPRPIGRWTRTSSIRRSSCSSRPGSWTRIARRRRPAWNWCSKSATAR